MDKLLEILIVVYGVLTLIVKFTPTLPESHWLLTIIKILGKITNRQSDDDKVREYNKVHN